jgi:hypothetical protein
MEFLAWLKLALALVLVAIGLFVLAAWALLRQLDADDR